MGTFRVDLVVENHVHRDRSARVPQVLVDTGSEHTWIAQGMLEKLGVVPEKKDVPFLMANGQTVTRQVGFAILRIESHFTIDEVVFAQKGDLQLLGARTLEGLNLTVDSRRKRLVAAGPVPAA
jgi:predicted aspartyl protease